MDIACCYYPTTVAIVDDDKRMLEALALQLANTAPCLTFQAPQQALLFFKQNYHAAPFTQRVLLQPEEDKAEHRLIDIDLRAIHKQAYNPNRFAEVSVLIVDYDMPEINGFELCQRLKQHPFKKIMLTGEATYDLAVNLFNAGIIDKFIVKNNPRLLATLLDAIHELQQQYFHDLSTLILASLTHHPHHPAACLDDPAFITLFYHTKQQLNAVEYYLMDGFGSYLFLNAKAQASCLVIKNTEDMHAWYETARYAQAPEAITKPMQHREKILYLHFDEDYQLNPRKWLPYLHSAHQLHGRENYFYALVPCPQPPPSAPTIRPYQDYLDGLS